MPSRFMAMDAPGPFSSGLVNMIATRPGRSKLSAGVASHMDVLVTGATGFVGANVARLLLSDGYRVRVLARPASSHKALEGCPVEVVRGDILEPDAVAAAVSGCAKVFQIGRASCREGAEGPSGDAVQRRT